MPNKATLSVYNQSGNPHGWAPVEINEERLIANLSGKIELAIGKYSTITHLVVNGRNCMLILVNGEKAELPLILIAGANIQAYVSNILHPQEASPTLSTN